MKNLALGLTYALTWLFSISAVHALTPAEKIDNKAIDELVYKLKVDLPREIPTAEKAVAQFYVGENGHVLFPQITHSSTDFDIDFAVLEAVCALSPTAGLPSEISRGFEPTPIQIVVDSKKGFEVNPVFEELAASTGKKCLFAYHRIPLSILYRYPGTFTERELRSSENLITQNSDMSDEQANSTLSQEEIQEKYEIAKDSLLKHYENWDAFFKSNKTATRKLLIEFSKRL